MSLSSLLTGCCFGTAPSQPLQQLKEKWLSLLQLIQARCSSPASSVHHNLMMTELLLSLIDHLYADEDVTEDLQIIYSLNPSLVYAFTPQLCSYAAGSAAEALTTTV